MLNLVADFQQNKDLILNQKFVNGIRSILCDSSLDKVCTIISLLIQNKLLFSEMVALISFL